MKTVAHLAALLLLLGATGCLFGGHKKTQVPPPTHRTVTSRAATNAPANNFIIKPDEGVVGRVASVNDDLRFVVLTFPLGQLPPLGTRMNIFRNGQIVGEVRISGPEKDDNSVADIVDGDAQKGDEVRPR